MVVHDAVHHSVRYGSLRCGGAYGGERVGGGSFSPFSRGGPGPPPPLMTSDTHIRRVQCEPQRKAAEKATVSSTAVF